MRAFWAAAIVLPALACAPTARAPAPVPIALPVVDTLPVPLNELGVRSYHGVQGGLYSGGVNVPSADYHIAGIARARAVQPLAVNGLPSGTGRYVLLSIGGSGASAAWCSSSSAPPCNGWSFTGRAVSEIAVNHSALVIVNGAIPGADYRRWIAAADSNYNRIRDTRLAPLGLSENQVQAVWMILPDSATHLPLRASASDASPQMEHLAQTLRALKSRYPNLHLVFISSAVYGGYSAEGETPSYESGIIVKWVIQRRIDQTSRGCTDAGGNTCADPWISWGPYLWARGAAARNDGLAWPRSDFDPSGMVLSQSGEARLGGMLLDFFKTSPYARCWFLIAASCD
jgi:hypothetical protein